MGTFGKPMKTSKSNLDYITFDYSYVCWEPTGSHMAQPEVVSEVHGLSEYSLCFMAPKKAEA